MRKIRQIYEILHKAYGPQGWWPLTERYKFIPEHKGKKPDTEKRKFEIIIGAILTQNTAWKNVEKAIIELNKRNLIDKNKLKSLPAKKLGKIIKSSGYFNQKAKKIKAMLYFLESDRRVNRENLLDVWGIGPETADSIMLYAYEKPFFVIDAYTKRIFSRLGVAEKNASYDELQELFHKSLSNNIKIFKEYHALLVEHAKRSCRTKPLCKQCILRRYCNYWRNSKTL